LQLPPEALQRARDELVNHDLLAFDQHLHQLLSLHPEPRSRELPSTPTPLTRDDACRDAPAHIREILKQLGGAS
jgi:hypothetical protein